MSDLVKALEGDEVEVYDAQQDRRPRSTAIAADEREHAEIWKRLDGEAKAIARPRAGGGRRCAARRAGDGRRTS